MPHIESTVMMGSEQLQLECPCSPPSPFTASNLVILSSPGPEISESQPLSEIFNSDSLPFSFGDCSFISDSGVSIATTLVEEIIQGFTTTQDSLDSTITTNAIAGLEDDKSDAYEFMHSDPETAARVARQERMKELMERRFTHPQKMTPSYSSRER
jgi:hypothetical protein